MKNKFQHSKYASSCARSLSEKYVFLASTLSMRVKNGVEMKGNSALVNKETDENLPKTLNEETRRYSSSREAISNKYATVRQ
ncbi:hypothetical protein JHK82_044338 [Glycine max]|nr:hypothetical protein JHK82_044338 [Glycine max]